MKLRSCSFVLCLGFTVVQGFAPLPLRGHQSVVSRRISQPLKDCRTSICLNAATTKDLDSDAITKYGGAIAVQMIGISCFLGLLDVACSVIGTEQSSLPLPVTGLLFGALSLKSRVFSPLNNKRPELDKAMKGEKTRGFNDRQMPSWTPPGVTFPIMWVLIVAPLRAYSTTLVLGQHGHFLDPTILALMLHLSIGDTWNTVNNAERRLGAAVPGIFCVWLSVLNAAKQYSEVDQTAGLCLGLTAVWITVAGLLITDTWRINNTDGDEPLYPYVGQATTEFTPPFTFLPF